MAIPKKIWANSGDSHFVEPPDLFQERLPKALADRMPKSQKFDGYEIITVDGQQFKRNMPKPGSTGDTISDLVIKRAPGANDPVLRLRDLDEEGIWAEVTFPSIGIWASSIKSRDLLAAGVRALNDWAKEYIMAASPRLVPTARSRCSTSRTRWPRCVAPRTSGSGRCSCRPRCRRARSRTTTSTTGTRCGPRSRRPTRSSRSTSAPSRWTQTRASVRFSAGRAARC